MNDEEDVGNQQDVAHKAHPSDGDSGAFDATTLTNFRLHCHQHLRGQPMQNEDSLEGRGFFNRFIQVIGHSKNRPDTNKFERSELGKSGDL